MYEAVYEDMYDARNPKNWNQNVEISTKSDRDVTRNDVRNASDSSTSEPSLTEITFKSTASNDEQGMVVLHIVCCVSNTRVNRIHNQIQRACSRLPTTMFNYM